jgi:hypothetical protein
MTRLCNFAISALCSAALTICLFALSAPSITLQDDARAKVSPAAPGPAAMPHLMPRSTPATY